MGPSWHYRGSSPALGHLVFPSTVWGPWPAQEGAQPFGLQQHCREQAYPATVPARKAGLDEGFS